MDTSSILSPRNHLACDPLFRPSLRKECGPSVEKGRLSEEMIRKLENGQRSV